MSTSNQSAGTSIKASSSVAKSGNPPALRGIPASDGAAAGTSDADRERVSQLFEAIAGTLCLAIESLDNSEGSAGEHDGVRAIVCNAGALADAAAKAFGGSGCLDSVESWVISPGPLAILEKLRAEADAQGDAA